MHTTWLGEIDVTIGALQAAATPYATVTAYNPDTAIAAMATAITNYGTATAIATLAAGIDSIVLSYADAFYDNLRYYELPGIAAAVYNANLVQSSAYAIAHMLALMSATELATKASIPLYAAAVSEFTTSPKVTLQSHLDMNRLKIIAKVEQADKDLEIDIHDATWDLDLYKYGEDMMRSIGGGGAVGGVSKPSKTQSALGGAMAGASVGTAISPGYGTAIGAVVGGIAGYMSN
jgi:hypothetical protein